MRGLALAVAGLTIVCAPALADHAPVSIFVDFSRVSPAVPSAPQIVRLPLPSSPGPVEILATLRFDDAPPSAAVSGPELFVRTRRGEWTPLFESVPVRLLADGATGDEAVTLDLKASPPWSAEPARRTAKLSFEASGVSLGETQLSWTIEQALVLTPDPRGFDSPDVDPTRAGEYEYPARRYQVRANVAWTLAASIGAELMREGAAHPLAGELLFVRAFDGSIQPLRVEGPPVVVASGDPTGETDAAAEVRLVVRTRGVEPGGEYGGAIELSLAPTPPVR